MMFRLELIIGYNTKTIGFNPKWKWDNKSPRPYETAEHSNKVCIEYGCFYYERDSDLLDWLRYYKSIDYFKSCFCRNHSNSVYSR